MSSVDEQNGLGNEIYYENDYGKRPPENYIWLLLEIIKFGRPGNIVDLGSGPGLFLEMASKWGLDATGVDGSKDAIRISLRRNPKLKVIHSLLSDRLPFEDSSIDNILLNQVIEHLPTLVFSRVLIESRRILRKGGMLFIHSPSKGNKREVEKDPTHINPLYPSELERILKLNGFEIVTQPNHCRFHAYDRFSAKILRGLMNTSLRDQLSATANAYAKKKFNE